MIFINIQSQYIEQLLSKGKPNIYLNMKKKLLIKLVYQYKKDFCIYLVRL